VRFIKMLGLAAMAVAAVLAFVGATTASADTACKVSVADSGECPEGSRYTLPLVVKAKSIGKATLLAEGLKTECTSEITGEAKTNEGAHVGIVGLITAATWSSCEGSCKKATSEGLPWTVLAVALTLTWHVKKDTVGNPSALLECTLFGFPVNCLYEAETALFSFTPSSSSTTAAQLVAKEVPLKRGGDSEICPANGKWDGTYEIISPKPLWLAALP
jgi:hypothetical protein